MATEASITPLTLENAEQDTAKPPPVNEINNNDWMTEKRNYDSDPPEQESQVLRRSRTKLQTKSQEDSLLAALCAWIVEHQLGLSLNLLSLLALTHVCFPRSRKQTRKFFELSYYNPSSGRYGLGWDDVFMVCFWIISFTGLRVAVMDYVLVPLAQNSGIAKKKKKVRFAEQAWVLIYYGSFWSLGMYVMYNSDYWLNLPNMWVGWPDREMNGLSKWYYLVQFAFWIQQILVVNIEERRKDHYQMFSHHLITCSLMLTSYGYHQTKVGNLILCLMDFVDLVFPLAKILKYLEYRVACDIAFGVFMITWFITRHVFYLIATHSIYSHSAREIDLGCYWGSNEDLRGPVPAPDRFNHFLQPFKDPAGMVCWTHQVKWVFVGMMLMLQVILCIWFCMIIRVAWKVIQGGEEAEDPRSGEEDEGESEHVVVLPIITTSKNDAFIEVPPLEEEVGVESINLTGHKSSGIKKYRKGAGTASGVTLHSDRKELLGRIGCDHKGA